MKILLIIGVYLIVTTSSTKLYSYFTERADDIDDFCDLKNLTKRYVFCDSPPDPIPEIIKVPSNVMQLEERCLFFKTFAPCNMKWDFKCRNEIELYQLSALLESCEKDSTSYQSIEENIECIHGTFKKYLEKEIPCKMEWEKVVDEYEKFKKTKMADLFPHIHDDKGKYMKGYLWYFIDFGCFMYYLDLECPKAHDAVMEFIVKKHVYLDDSIKDVKEAGMLEIVDYLDLEDRQKAWTKESVKMFEDKCEEIDCSGWIAELPKKYNQQVIKI